MYKLQSILLSKKSYNLDSAVNWLVANKFKVSKLDATEHYWRFRQNEPSALRREGFTTFRTKEVAPNVKFIFSYKDD
jgi:hypothetical protein